MKINVIQAACISILLYRSETWIRKEQLKEKLNSFNTNLTKSQIQQSLNLYQSKLQRDNLHGLVIWWEKMMNCHYKHYRLYEANLREEKAWYSVGKIQEWKSYWNWNACLRSTMVNRENSNINDVVTKGICIEVGIEYWVYIQHVNIFIGFSCFNRNLYTGLKDQKIR